MSAPAKIDCFRGKYAFLSNFYPIKVTYGGLTYPNNEAAFQAQKTLKPEEREGFTCLPPSDAKRRGRHVRLRPDWEDVKCGIMEEIVRAKFTQNLRLRQQLIETGSAQLIEGNSWNDRFWGVDARSGTGKNHLGEILMKIRAELARDEDQKVPA